MKDLIRFEFRKLRRQKSFYICLVVMLAMMLISGITYKIMSDHAAEIAEITEGQQLLPKSGGAFMLGFLSASSFAMISAILVSILVCGDYESQIVKNIYARGYSRENFYFAKLIYVFTVISVMFLAAFAVSALFGIAVFGDDGIDGRTFLLIAMQYIVCLAEVSLYFALCSAIKKLGASIAVCIFAPIVLSLLFELADTSLKINDFKVASVWMESFLSDLSSVSISAERLIVCVALSVVYAAIFIFTGYRISKKTDL